jgi:hypothetical protein
MRSAAVTTARALANRDLLVRPGRRRIAGFGGFGQLRCRVDSVGEGLPSDPALKQRIEHE